MVTAFINTKLFEKEKKSSKPLSNNFTITTPNGKTLRFKRKTVAYPLQYDVYYRNNYCGDVLVRNGRLMIGSCPGREILLEIVNPCVDDWSDEQITSITADVISKWLEIQGM